MFTNVPEAEVIEKAGWMITATADVLLTWIAAQALVGREMRNI